MESINMPKQGDWQNIFNKCSNYLAIMKATNIVENRLGFVFSLAHPERQ